MRAEDYFVTEWPAELPRLRRLLARNGIAPDDVDDVLQDSAARLYAAWGRVFEDRPLRPLVTTIVLNAARDHHRRAAHRPQPVSELPENLMVEPSVDRAALARLDVSRAARALATLPVAQREAVLQAVSDDLAGEQLGRSRAPAARRMAVSRARRQLVTVMELTAAAVGIAVAWTRRTASGPAAPVAAALAAAAVAVSTLTVLQPGPATQHDARTAAIAPLPGHRQDASVRAATPRHQAPHLIAFGGGSGLFTGSGRWWSPSTGTLVTVRALGERADVGSGTGRAGCGLHVADTIVVTFRCLTID